MIMQSSLTNCESALLSLPAEIRLQIYRHLFRGQTVKANAFHYPEDEEVPLKGHISLQSPSLLLNILFACRTIHSEAIISFYIHTSFRFERHSIDEINWSLNEVRAAFPAYRPVSTSTEAGLANARDLVRYVYYAGNDFNVIRDVGTIFPSLRLFEFDLSWDHLGVDQTNFDRAMKYAIRNREWRHAIKDALEQRFPDGMVHAVWDLQKFMQAKGGLDVTLHWRLAYRFIEFVGVCHLDDWILRVRDPEHQSKNVYDIRQDPLFFEMG